jgi:hypothetical protein
VFSSDNLLFVIFDNLRRADFGLARVFSKLAQRPALSQEIPALVEFDFQFRQTRPVIGGKLALTIEALFFFYQTVNVIQHRPVFVPVLVLIIAAIFILALIFVSHENFLSR